MIAALFVATGGIYFNRPDVDPWDAARDARKYAGPHPVVAHPPCERWGRYWSGGPMLAGTSKAKLKGDDNGCFESALASVRRFGGVLEHPEASHAFTRYGLPRPLRAGHWTTERPGEWVCCVEQGHYGHAARKATWLFLRSDSVPLPLMWGTSGQRLRMDDDFHSKEERARAVRTGRCQRLSKKQRIATPPAFADLLISIARGSVKP